METDVPPMATVQNFSQSFYESELSNLKTKLKEMTTFCRQLQENLEYMEKKTKMLEMRAAQGQNKPQDDEISSGSYDFASLKEKMKELVTMNLNWQKFSHQQEKHIQELNEKVTRLEKELATGGGMGQLPESQQIEFDQLLLAKKHMCNSLEEEKNQIEEENRQLRVKVVSTEKSLDEFKERCQLLEAQLVMYQEDFKNERADRERAQSRITELELKLRDLQSQQAPVAQTSMAMFSPSDTYSNRAPYKYPHQQNEDVLRGRGFGLYQTDGAFEDLSFPASQATKKHKGQTVQPNRTVVVPTTSIYQTDGVDESDCFAVELVEDGPNCHIALGDMLSCPNCRKVFSRDRHLELLDHMEDCN